MICHKRFYNFINKIDYIINNGIIGSIVECGVWRGGAICFAKKYLNIMNENRNVYAFDSFEGLPEPNDNYDFLIDDKTLAKNICGTKDDINNNCLASINDFYETVELCNIQRDDIIIKKGWFKDTCKNFNEQIAILRFDGDWYESTMDVLNNLYDKVVNGGVIIFDDYNYWNGNKIAVDEFMKDKEHKKFNFTEDSKEMWFIK